MGAGDDVQVVKPKGLYGGSGGVAGAFLFLVAGGLC